MKRLRSLGDLNALRLLIDLCQAQNLSADGGISRAALRHEYERKKCGERCKHIIWIQIETEFSIVSLEYEDLLGSKNGQ